MKRPGRVGVGERGHRAQRFRLPATRRADDDEPHGVAGEMIGGDRPEHGEQHVGLGQEEPALEGLDHLAE